MAENEAGTLEQIATNLDEFFDPLILVFEKVSGEKDAKSPAYELRHFLAEVGYLLPPEFEEAFALVEKPTAKYDEQVKPKLEALFKGLKDITPGTVLIIFDSAKSVVEAVIKIKDDVERILDKMELTQFPTLKNKLVEFAKQLPENLTYYLVVKYLEEHGKPVLPLLIFVGFVEINPQKADEYEKVNKVVDEKFEYELRNLNWDNLFGFFSDPTEKLKELFNPPSL